MTIPDPTDNERPEDALRITTDVGPFAIVPVWLLAHDLGAPELRVYIAIRSFADALGEGARPRREVIAGRANVSLATYKRARAKLEAAGVLTKTARRRSDGGFTGYDFHLPTLPVFPQVATGGSPAEPGGGSGQSGGSPAEPGRGSPAEPGRGSPAEPVGEQTLGTDQGTDHPPGDAAASRPVDDEQPPLGAANGEEPPEPPAALDAQAVVAAYVDAYTASHDGRRPIGRDIGKIGRDAKQLVDDRGVRDDELLAAAERLGRVGKWNDLARELAAMRSERSPAAAARPPAGRRDRNGSIGPAPVLPDEIRADTERHRQTGPRLLDVDTLGNELVEYQRVAALNGCEDVHEYIALTNERETARHSGDTARVAEITEQLAVGRAAVAARSEGRAGR